MIERVAALAGIGSSSYDTSGLERCAETIATYAADLGDLTVERLPPERQINAAGEVEERPLGPLLRLERRPAAHRRVLLCIHYDTVYGEDDPFREVRQVEPGVLRGPGVADAKGGLVVLLTALAALERSPFATDIGWEVLLNPDEEIGSPGSGPLLAAAAARHGLGLLYEPALPDGSLVSARKGSGNYTLVVRGRSAHAGRNPADGRNAIHAIAEVVSGVAALNGAMPGITTNVGRIEGGGAVNVVPDLAIARCNVRAETAAGQQFIERSLRDVLRRVSDRDGFQAELHGGFHNPPKVADEATVNLLRLLAGCGRELGLSLDWQPSGGACDGNKLAAAGLTNVDSLGVRGGAIHSNREFLLLDSLAERAKLSALLLMKLAAGEIPWDWEIRRGKTARME